ncbi:MAG: hypothetical protein LC794_17320 [Acidobacteria bacterium]|nr:hypothetical protein [Acidobacteriota bacterium]
MSKPTDTPTITLSTIENQTGPDFLGYVVNWRLMNIRVQESDLKLALDHAGFSNHLPALPTPRKALRRALEAWIAERTQQQTGIPQPVVTAASDGEDENQKETTLIRVINKAGAEHLVFGIVSENVDFNKLGLSYGTQLRILLHKKTGEIVCTTDADGVISAQNESSQVTREIIPYYNEFRRLFFTDDLSKMVHAIVTSMNAVSLRKEGGVYFVPHAERHQIELAKQLIASLPTTSSEKPYLLAIPVINSEVAKADVALAIHYGFLDELKSMASDLDRFAQAEPGSVRSETISNRLLQYKHVKEKVGMYATLLSMQQGDIVKGLEALTRKAQEIVLGKPSTENPHPPASQLSSDDPLPATQSDPDLSNDETIMPPAAATHVSTPMLF